MFRLRLLLPSRKLHPRMEFLGVGPHGRLLTRAGLSLIVMVHIKSVMVGCHVEELFAIAWGLGSWDMRSSLEFAILWSRSCGVFMLAFIVLGIPEFVIF
ncbi:hypothetical protein V6N13_028506 [Hibiscus sabdariffa]